MKELLVRTITGISLIILVIGSILAGPALFMGINLVILGLGTRELYSLYSLDKTMKPHLLMALSSELLLVVVYMVMQHQWSPWYFLLPAAGWITGAVWARTLIPGMMVLLWFSKKAFLYSHLFLHWVTLPEETGFFPFCQSRLLHWFGSMIPLPT